MPGDSEACCKKTIRVYVANQSTTLGAYIGAPMTIKDTDTRAMLRLDMGVHVYIYIYICMYRYIA